MIANNLKKRTFTSLLLFFLFFLIYNFNFLLIYSLIVLGVLSLIEFYNAINGNINNLKAHLRRFSKTKPSYIEYDNHFYVYDVKGVDWLAIEQRSGS